MTATHHEKELAATAAAALVESGMVVGLGSGSTAEAAIRLIGQRVTKGLKIIGVPTSENSRQLALEYGIPLTGLDTVQRIDLVIDGADEVDPDLNLIKGGGGALLREKIVAAAAREVVIIVDSAKLVPQLGRFPLPVEFIPFGQAVVSHALEALQAPYTLRKVNGEHIFTTDEGNYIFDIALQCIDNAPALARQLDAAIGLVEHGLFINMCDRVIVGRGNTTETLYPTRSRASVPVAFPHAR